MTPVQVGIERDARPVTGADAARSAMADLGIAHGAVEAIDAEVGVWLVELPDALVAELTESGFIERGEPGSGPYFTAEMP